MIELSPVATHVDQAGGFVEEARFREVSGSNIFSVAYLPAVPARLGVVICCSALVEQLTNYRHEVLLARALAARGLAVQRFHYRGTGHSEGEETEISLDAMVEDTLAAGGWLQSQTGVQQLAFMGTRWGGLIAGTVAKEHPGAPLVLWDPIVDGGHYFRELIRGRLVREMKDPRAAAGVESWKDELDRQGCIDILGYPLHRSLYESGRTVRLDAFLAGRTAPVLLVQFGRRDAVRADYARLEETLKRGGAMVDVHFIREEPAWLFPGHVMKSSDRLVRITTDWLLGVREWGTQR